LAAREGTIPCQPMPPCIIPGISWIFLGVRLTRKARPGIRQPRNLTG
jgi:hypothetical protein